MSSTDESSIRSMSASEHSSAATSPPTSDASEPLYQPALGLSKEAQAIVSDLANFVALGCLCFEDSLSEDQEEPGTWQEVTTLPVTVDGATSSNLALLQRHGWVRLHSSRSHASTRWTILRVYLLYSDVGLSCIKRDDSTSRLKNAIRALLGELDISSDTWTGYHTPGNKQPFNRWAMIDGDNPSLFYVFNKLPSPSPDAKAIEEKYAREALEDLLEETFCPPGLKTKLYPYQRRSAGIMLQRESCSSKFELDPRLEVRNSPDGSRYYYDCRKGDFQRDPQYYETCRGGILAETMGLGKTVICLALILATKYHLPKVPAEYALPPTRRVVGSLASMAISAINLQSIPWRVELGRIQHYNGDEMSTCTERLQKTPPTYDIPQIPQRWQRTTRQLPPHRMTLTSTTIIVVPQNLCKQWQSEIGKHTECGSIKVLVMDDRKRALPPAEDLRTYDVILFSRNRFEMEIKHGADDQGRRRTNLACRCPYIGSSRKRDCNCLQDDMLYDSPLQHLHFKRIIVDEGHFFTHSNSNAALVADKLVIADHRWVVSGTPARDLLGVEIDMSATDDLWPTEAPGTNDVRVTLLEQRRNFSDLDRAGAIDSLGSLAKSFLKVRPWCEHEVRWKDYIFRHEDFNKLTYSGFSTCLSSTLQRIVVKTRPDDVEKDIELPPLKHEIVRLEPSFYDKLTANLFTLVLLANAITSEREDRDYIFHKDSAKARQQLISNLRQSAFFWTGFDHEDVLASIKNSTGYLAKDGTSATLDDRQLLTQTLTCTTDVLNSSGWGAMSRSHELGVFVAGWPQESAEHWAFDESREPLLTGISQLLDAQKFVNERLSHENPGDGLSGAGIKAMAPVRNASTKEKEFNGSKPVTNSGENKAKSSKNPKLMKPILNKAGIPMSSLEGEPSLRRRASFSSHTSPPKRVKISTVSKSERRKLEKKTSLKLVDSGGKNKGGKQKETVFDQPVTSGTQWNDCSKLPPTSQYAEARVVGTSSAKMSYLLSQILEHYKHEKILVFYQGDNIAYYIAQVLELFNIKHEIYAKSLAAHLKAAYVVRFDQEPQDRVLLMDVSQAAFGLNLSSASRIYFVNPVCRPDVEAQAIKRAHRIGQTRPVYVETLVLKDSIEEQMLERSKRMTRAEHLDAKTLEDDGGIRQIIQSARLLPIREDEKQGRGQMAPLEGHEQLWARPGWAENVNLHQHGRRNKRKRVSFEDVTDPRDTENVIEDDQIHHPQVNIKQIRRSISPNNIKQDRERFGQSLVHQWPENVSFPTSSKPNII